MSLQDDQVAAFHLLHASGCFVMPNPWDAGSARVLEKLGFKALATTSAGLAWTLGSADDDVTLDQTIQHLRAVVDAVDVPVNADFRDGFAVEPPQVSRNVKLAAVTGIAGLSLEDSTGDRLRPLYDFDLAVERVRAARQAIDETGTGIVLTGRSEGFVIGRPDIDETIRRLRAYAEAGADCLYAPRLSTVEHVAAIVAAVAPRPVNLVINAPFITVAEAAALGVRRQRGGHPGAHRLGRVPAGSAGDCRCGDVLRVRAVAGRRGTVSRVDLGDAAQDRVRPQDEVDRRRRRSRGSARPESGSTPPG